METTTPKNRNDLKVAGGIPAGREFHHRLVAQRVISSAIDVYRAMGTGHNDVIYREALAVELARRRIPFERGRLFDVRYDDKPVGRHRLSCVVDDCVIVEVKVARRIDDLDSDVVHAYLRASGYPAGLILNFAGPRLKARRMTRDGRVFDK